MSELRLSNVRVNGITLHIAEAGPDDGPLLFLLHGFPEYWRAWKDYILPFAAAGFHVIAPDQRGYNLSEKPKDIAAYDLDQLAADIFGLADRWGARSFSIVGHDWGGTVGWWIATSRPERLDRLAVTNAPHPSVWREFMDADPEQKRRSRYVKLFRMPWLPEFLIRRRHFAALAQSLRRTDGGPTATELEHYHAAWSIPGALTAMVNWYRAFLRKRLPPSSEVKIGNPLLLIWGERDPFGITELARASLRLCARGRVFFIAEGSHWVQHEETSRCREALLDFLSEDQAGPRPASNS
jgi:pimeloyl-ACP methyl ester carboxylesterase